MVLGDGGDFCTGDAHLSVELEKKPVKVTLHSKKNDGTVKV